MSYEDLLSEIDELRQPANRLAASRDIAKRFDAKEIIFFIEDPLLKIFLPAQGFPQTLPSAKDWRAFLEMVRRNENTVCDLRSPYSGDFQTVRGFNISEGAMIVFLGAPAKLTLPKDLKAIFALVAASLVGETALKHSEGQAQTLRESAEMYRALANSLDTTKQTLQSTLHERDKALEDVRQTLLERKKQNEMDAKLLNGTQALLSTLNYAETLKNIVQTAVEHLSDWCVIYALADERSMTMKAVECAAKEPAVQKALKSYMEKYSTVNAGPTPVGRVIETKSDQIFSGLSRERILALSKDPAQGEAFLQCRPRAVMAHPMIQGGRLIGVISYGFVEREEDFSTEDLLLAQRWTAQSTMAFTNAKLLQEAESAVQARDELMSISSHEIRTPITAMKLQVQFVKRQIERSGPESVGAEKFVKLVHQSDQQLRKLTRLVDDMLDLSRINTGKFSISLGRTNLSDVVNDTLDRLVPHLISAGCSVRVHVAPDVLVSGDVSRLEQVLTNLLTNAARYGAGKPIRVSLKKVHDFAELRVQDEGHGIQSEDLERIFEKFERAISRNEVSGLGLGLFIVRQILEAHKGNIHAESVPGKGATFIARIPLLKSLENHMSV